MISSHLLSEARSSSYCKRYDRAKFSFVSLSSLIIGVGAGYLFFLYDVFYQVTQLEAQFVSWLNFWDVLLIPMGLYLLGASIGMWAAGNFLCFVFSLGFPKLVDSSQKVISCLMGFAILCFMGGLLAMLFVPSPLARSGLDILNEALIYGVGSMGFAGLTFVLLSYFSLKKAAVFMGLFLALVSLLWLFWVPSRFVNIDSKEKQATVSASTDPRDNFVLKSKPNIIWLLIDTARADRLSCYGYEKKTTPFIDRIAQEGVLYESAYATSSWTLPSHASMFTGLFPRSHGVNDGWRWLASEFTTFAEILDGQGYKTACFSNNVFVSPKTNVTQGFQIFTLLRQDSLRNSLLFPSALLRGLNQATGHAFPFLTRWHRVLQGMSVQGMNTMDNGCAMSNQMAQNYIRQALTDSRPFFVFINYMEAHDPYGSSPDWDKFLTGNQKKKFQALHRRRILLKDLYPYYIKEASFTDQDKEIINALYEGDLTYVDRKIGELVDFLRNENMLDNTILIISSDHGEHLGEHNIVNHMYSVYHPLTHIPLIIRYPKIFAPNSRKTEKVQNIDIFPTLLDILNINQEKRPTLNGTSLVGPRSRPFAISESNYTNIFSNYHDLFEAFPHVDQRTFGGLYLSILYGDYEYILLNSSRQYLFNLAKDPYEKENLIDAEEKTVQQLKEMFRQWRRETKSYWRPSLH